MELVKTPYAHLNLRMLDDYGLVEKAVKGDNTAFSALFERYRSSVFHYISKRTHNVADAHDLTMEAFSKAFLKLSTFVPRHAFSTWLFRIAHNHCVDFVRRNRLAKSHYAEFDAAAFSNLSDGMLNPEETMIQLEHSAMIFNLLQQMNPRYRRMLELRFFEELSYEEIAVQLELPIGTVKAQLFRAKEAMRQLLEHPRAHA